MAAEQKPPRRWWAPIGAGAVLCLACCLAPLPIAAGALGGGTLLVSLSRLEPLGISLLVLGAAGLMWSRLRARRTGCTGADDHTSSTCANSGCGCAAAIS